MLELAQYKVFVTAVRHPIAGVIGSVHLIEEQPARTNAPIVTHIDEDVPELGLREGSKMIFRADRPDEVAVYQRIPCSVLPEDLREQLDELTDRPEPGASASPGTRPPLPQQQQRPPTHLRLVR